METYRLELRDKDGSTNERKFDAAHISAAYNQFEEELEKLESGHELTLYDECDRVQATSNEFLQQYITYSSDEWTECKEKPAEYRDEPSVYFDIDGTLGEFNKNASMEEIFDTRNHYFRHIKPEEMVINLAMKLHEDGVDVCVISAAARDTIKDKYDWIREHLPFIPDENICFAPLGSDKTQFVKQNAEISILIDDYNPNLKDWKEHGGHAIKMLNGINSSHSGYSEIDFERLKERQAQFKKWEAETDIPDYEVDKRKDKLVFQMYSAICAVAEAIERDIDDIMERNGYEPKFDKEME